MWSCRVQLNAIAEGCASVNAPVPGRHNPGSDTLIGMIVPRSNDRVSGNTGRSDRWLGGRPVGRPDRLHL